MKAIGTVVGVVLFGATLGFVSARRKHERDVPTLRTAHVVPDPENAAAGYLYAVEKVWQPELDRVGVASSQTNTPNVAEAQERYKQGVVAMRTAADRAEFDPDSVVSDGKPVGSGRILSDMANGALLLYTGAYSNSENRDWKAALEDLNRLSKLAAQAWSSRSGVKAASDIESTSVRAWWKVVRRHHNNPDFMVAAERWLGDLERSMPPRPVKQPERDRTILGKLTGSGDESGQVGIKPKNTPDPIASYRAQHTSLAAAKFALHVLKTRTYKRARADGSVPNVDFPIEPSTGRPFGIYGTPTSFEFYSSGPNALTSTDDIVFRFSELDSNPERPLY